MVQNLCPVRIACHWVCHSLLGCKQPAAPPVLGSECWIKTRTLSWAFWLCSTVQQPTMVSAGMHSPPSTSTQSLVLPCLCFPPLSQTPCPLQENIRRNFGMPQPNGYRKAMRFMRHANKFGLPIVTFVDTPGAYAGRTAEELGQVRRLGGSLEGSIGFRQRVRGSQKQQVGSRP